MKVIATAEQVKMIELDDFKKFHIEAIGTFEQIAAQFQRAGAGQLLNAEHAEVSIAFIEQQAGGKLEDSAWLNGLKMMLDYANSKGWVNQQQQAVAAHIEWTQPASAEV